MARASNARFDGGSTVVENPDLSAHVVSMLRTGVASDAPAKREQPEPEQPTSWPLWRERFLGGSPDRERELFADFARDIHRLQKTVARRHGARQPAHGFHVKTLLAVRGKLHVRRDLPPELCAGFLRPGATLDVTIRYSASAHDARPDAKRNGRGIALRIEDEGQRYDLLFSDSPRSHARDARQFMAFVKVLSAPWYRKPVPLLRELGLREGLRLVHGALQQTFLFKPSLAATRFWGKVPMRINDHAVKYQLVPRHFARLAPGASGNDFLREDLIARMAKLPVHYDLRVQRFVDQARTPLEDHSIEWLERDAPPETIGKLVIEKGAFQRQPPELEAEIERMAFNPWNTIDALRPLGSLNRARKFVYAASAELRARPAPRDLFARLQDRWEEPVLAVASRAFAWANQRWPWHELWRPLGVLNLVVMRDGMRRRDLHDAEDMLAPLAPSVAAGTRETQFRDPQGRNNDLQFPDMGSVGRRFGRNVPRREGLPERGAQLVTPSPREVSRHLLARRGEFVPAKGLNLLAAGWIQFQTHDWFAHDQTPGKESFDVPIARQDPWAGARPMRIPATPRAEAHEAERAERLPPTYANQASHWWDGSQIYGADAKTTERLRSGAKLRLTKDRLLPCGKDGLPITGSNQNWWFGLELMHTAFAREHNQICNMLHALYPSWSDDLVFETARLINVALMAKIHTIEWTPAVLAHPALKSAMEAHWWGLAGERVYRLFGRLSESELVSGIPGSRRDHFEVPFSLTEEFVAVYRMHPLLPDEIPLRSLAHAEHSALSFREVAFADSRKAIAKWGLDDLAYSFGLAHPGAMCLHNYPKFLVALDADGKPLRDVGAIDILRDRERGIPRYNRFRERFGLARVSSYRELTGGDEALANALAQVYGRDPYGRDQVDRVDLLIGCLAEKPPRGFGFGDTAFRVFVLMASRRLKSDRFFTDDYREGTYTPQGLAWVRDNTMVSVLRRNFPELRPALRDVTNAFVPWDSFG